MNWILLLFVFVGNQGGMAQSAVSFETDAACELAGMAARGKLEGISIHGTIRVYWTCNHIAGQQRDGSPIIPRPR